MNLRHALLLAACASSLGAGSAGAQAVFTDAQGQEIFFNHVEGVVNCQGRAPALVDFFMPCGPGVSGTIRGRTVYAYLLLPGTPFNGISTIQVNVNFDGDGKGPIWGTFQTNLFGNAGTIEGTYTGKANITDLTMDLKAVGHGSGPAADGLQFKIEDVHATPGSPYGDVQVRVLNPPAQH